MGEKLIGHQDLDQAALELRNKARLSKLNFETLSQIVKAAYQLGRVHSWEAEEEEARARARTIKTTLEDRIQSVRSQVGRLLSGEERA